MIYFKIIIYRQKRQENLHDKVNNEELEIHQKSFEQLMKTRQDTRKQSMKTRLNIQRYNRQQNKQQNKQQVQVPNFRSHYQPHIARTEQPSHRANSKLRMIGRTLNRGRQKYQHKSKRY